ncbi:protoporphyrinogen oxidase 1 chloroplastic [Phtheirospermum japonicum]|uniref:Protoporphyrinogen oxidase 1 chloroplastic n=1 Tax=Phtheirospermum japonicum TaxID=374723 RepID=A0A830BT98_9LAMI|nr:protoporphyrinogen oxidase 1 chloroplastic [Phtheirospermum japonicum]
MLNCVIVGAGISDLCIAQDLTTKHRNSNLMVTKAQRARERKHHHRRKGWLSLGIMPQQFPALGPHAYHDGNRVMRNLLKSLSGATSVMKFLNA